MWGVAWPGYRYRVELHGKSEAAYLIALTPCRNPLNRRSSSNIHRFLRAALHGVFLTHQVLRSTIPRWVGHQYWAWAADNYRISEHSARPKLIWPLNSNTQKICTNHQILWSENNSRLEVQDTISSLLKQSGRYTPSLSGSKLWLRGGDGAIREQMDRWSRTTSRCLHRVSIWRANAIRPVKTSNNAT